MKEFLKRAFTEHLALKVLSLGLALVLFLIVRADKDAVAFGYVVVHYQFDRSGYVLTSKPPRQLRIRVVGPWSKVNRFDDRQLKPLRLKVEGGKKQSISFQPEMFKVPRGLRVAAISPPTAEIRVEKLVERKVPVTVRVVGEPAKGYALKGKPEMSPSSVLLRGPKGALERLLRSGLALSPLDVTNAEGPLEQTLEVVTLLPDFTEALTSNRIKVRQDIVAQSGEKALSEVPVEPFGFKETRFTPRLDAPEVGVWLKGPLPVLEDLDPKKLSLMLDLGDVGRRGVIPQSVVKEVAPKDVKGLPAGVTAHKVVPSRITVRLIRPEPRPRPPARPDAP